MSGIAEHTGHRVLARAKPDLLLRYLRLPPEAPDSGSGSTRVTALLVCIALVCAALAAGVLVQHFLGVNNILLVFLPVVLWCAVRYGFWAASFASALSIGAAALFTAPVFSLAVADPGTAWALLIFLLVSAFTSSLAAQLRLRAAAVARHSRVIEQLYAFSARLAALSATDELVREAALQIASVLQTETIVLVQEQGALRVRAASGQVEALTARERLAAAWCFEHGRPSGRDTDVFPGLSRLFLPLDAGRGAVGVLGIQPCASGTRLNTEDLKLLDALRDQVAVSIDRARLAEEMRATELHAATERLRTALLTSISHDLRTPLASILGNISSLRQYGPLYDDATRSEMLAYAEDETLRMSRFVDNVLHMTRIEAGVLRPSMENVDLSDLIGSALKRTEKRTARHRVVTDLAPDLPMVPLDFVLAEHVLVNLLDNAAKYSPPESTITITAAARADSLQIEIMDEGPGIAENDLPFLFDRFFRANVADHRRAGAGLGLAICKGFVEAMGGGIEVRNRSGRSGTIFTLTLHGTRASGNAS